LKLKCLEPLSNFAFNFNLCLYSTDEVRASELRRATANGEVISLDDNDAAAANVSARQRRRGEGRAEGAGVGKDISTTVHPAPRR
jgi:hypothetical protein